jgi:hypothetical protein
MKIIEHTIDIAAPTDVVWRVLTDFESYSEWNPFLAIEGRAEAVGDRLSVDVQPVGAKGMHFTPKIVELDPERSLVWLGRLLLPRIVDGTHEFRVEPLRATHSRFTQREIFRGLLVPFMGKIPSATRAGFVAMNEALAARVDEVLARG